MVTWSATNSIADLCQPPKILKRIECRYKLSLFHHPNEDPLTAAQREVLEETGYRAENWYPLGEWVVDGNRGCGTAYAFLATAPQPVALPNADDLEEQEIVLLARSELEEALFTNQFKVLA